MPENSRCQFIHENELQWQLFQTAPLEVTQRWGDGTSSSAALQAGPVPAGSTKLGLGAALAMLTGLAKRGEREERVHVCWESTAWAYAKSKTLQWVCSFSCMAVKSLVT